METSTIGTIGKNFLRVEYHLNTLSFGKYNNKLQIRIKLGVYVWKNLQKLGEQKCIFSIDIQKIYLDSFVTLQIQYFCTWKIQHVTKSDFYFPIFPVCSFHLCFIHWLHVTQFDYDGISFYFCVQETL